MAAQETSLSEALTEVEFVVNQRGEPRGVFVPVAVWEAMLVALENAEDLTIAQKFLERRRTARSPKEMGLLDWEGVADEWDDGKTA